ncbi:hypothetical protein Rsub_04834 [Raphidocelis subcapitata]|uniref:Water stress and hypersensitive response domain-containing protein n=1 Tax=Raphidocelis subcapitata TaxID=307507 RepID=A0A2V0P252_9CHLO|nr:hypothetical protein Rsub_04834 [Raphidocelis subcapitata]|eukprot:GBF91165.1 hypothetical protein Rsub_04834 [Raphidocelis subcapitata]
MPAGRAPRARCRRGAAAALLLASALLCAAPAAAQTVCVLELTVLGDSSLRLGGRVVKPMALTIRPSNAVAPTGTIAVGFPGACPSELEGAIPTAQLLPVPGSGIKAPPMLARVTSYSIEVTVDHAVAVSEFPPDAAGGLLFSFNVGAGRVEVANDRDTKTVDLAGRDVSASGCVLMASGGALSLECARVVLAQQVEEQGVALDIELTGTLRAGGALRRAREVDAAELAAAAAGGGGA